jgi:diguanylate cyclase (GGDEF)-like protein
MVLAASLAMLAGSWSLFLVEGFQDRARRLDAERIRLQGLARLVGAQTHTFLAAINVAMVMLNRWIAEHPYEDPRFSPAFNALVDEFREVIGGGLDIRLVMEDGGLFYLPSEDPEPKANVADREYFLAHRGDGGKGYFIAKPVKSRVTGIWGIPVSHPVAKNSAGVALLFGAIEFPSLDAVFHQSLPSESGSITLVREDGAILYRDPFVERVMGSEFTGYRELAQGYRESPNGVAVIRASPIDGKDRIIAWVFDQDYGIFTHVSAVASEIESAWAEGFLPRAAILLAMSALVTLLLSRVLKLVVRDERLRLELEALARTDVLTGLPNRRRFLERAVAELPRAARYARPFCVVMLDLDRFKRVNDSLGHAEGDRVLKEFAGKLIAGTRASDFCGRLGGEEFAVALPESGIESALEIAERILSLTREISTALGKVTASAGVALWDGSESLEQLFARADKALYEAKAGGRDRVARA